MNSNLIQSGTNTLTHLEKKTPQPVGINIKNMWGIQIKELRKVNILIWVRKNLESEK